MGTIARTVSDGGGKVVGIIPEALVPREVSGAMIGDTRITANMHDRKAAMASEAEAFIALPGGCVRTLGSPLPLVALLSCSHIMPNDLDYEPERYC
jgi:hypothetical protein